MSELEDRLQSLLENPEELGRVARMAQSLMGQSAPDDTESGGFPDGVQRLFRNLTGAGEKKHLLDALSPYLDEGRRRRLTRALRTAAAARLALAALSEAGGDDGV